MASPVAEWAPPSVMPSYSCLPEAVVDRLCHIRGMRTRGRGRGRGLMGVPVCSWTEAELSVLLAEERTGSLLAADARASGTYVAPSDVHGRGVFAARNISAGEQILPFYGQLVFHDLEVATPPSDARVSTARYGLGSLPRDLCCTVRKWKRTALQLDMHRDFWEDAERRARPTDVATHVATKRCYYTSRMASPDPVWVVPAPFCAAGFANAPDSHGYGNAIFVQAPLPVHTKEQLVLPWTAHVQVTEDIAVGEEILVDNGDVYAYFYS